MWSVRDRALRDAALASVDIDDLEDFEWAAVAACAPAARSGSHGDDRCSSSPKPASTTTATSRLALRSVDAARDAGADAVKFQTFRAEDLVMPGAPTADYQARQHRRARPVRDAARSWSSTRPQHRALRAIATRIGIEFFSTPFSEDAVDMLVQLGVRRIKLPSGEITNRAAGARRAATGCRCCCPPAWRRWTRCARRWAGSRAGARLASTA